MPVVCVDTAVYALSIDYYHYNFPIEDPAQLGSPDASQGGFCGQSCQHVRNLLSCTVTRNFAALQQAVHISFLNPSFLLMYDHVECNICGSIR